MNNPEISVIVPVYKVEKYLNKCIDSILAQTFKDFELILIDDGSPDSCGEICDEYARNDNRIKVIHSENRGAANARNLGLNEATGKYIGFVDSDDWIDNKIYEVMFNNIIDKNVDIIFCKLINVDMNQECSLVEEKIVKGYIKDISSQLIAPLIGNRLDKYDEKRVGSNIYRCLFKRKIINENNIRFKKKLVYGEDTLFIINYLDKCNNAYIVDKYLYYYRQNNTSLTKRYKQNFFHSISSYFNYLDEFSNREKYLNDENIQKRIEALKTTYIYISLVNEFSSKNNIKYKEKCKAVNKILDSEVAKKHYIFSNIINYPLKIMIVMMFFKLRLYRLKKIEL